MKWLAIYVLGVVVVSIIHGLASEEVNEKDQIPACIPALVWPLIAGALLVSSPFWLPAAISDFTKELYRKYEARKLVEKILQNPHGEDKKD